MPKLGVYKNEVVMCLPEANANKMSIVPHRTAGIDLKVNNFVTMVNNAGQRPVIVKDNVIKAINQFYNKPRSRYYSKLQKGKASGKRMADL
jgi:putative transposase